MLLATTAPARGDHVLAMLTASPIRVGVRENEPPPLKLRLLFIHFAGRLYTAKTLAFQASKSRFTGSVSCVPRTSATPSSVVSVSAVKVALEIGCRVRVRFANRKR